MYSVSICSESFVTQIALAIGAFTSNSIGAGCKFGGECDAMAGCHASWGAIAGWPCPALLQARSCYLGLCCFRRMVF